jgi:hypothetical protein
MADTVEQELAEDGYTVVKCSDCGEEGVCKLDDENEDGTVTVFHGLLEGSGWNKKCFNVKPAELEEVSR